MMAISKKNIEWTTIDDIYTRLMYHGLGLNVLGNLIYNSQEPLSAIEVEGVGIYIRDWIEKFNNIVGELEIE
jgi:hypothetical protein